MECTCTSDLDFLCQRWSMDRDALMSVHRQYPFNASPHVLSLLGSPHDPIGLQIVPDVKEIEDSDGLEDPLAEEILSAVPNLVHRYPHRVLWLVSSVCAAHCRFCTRKRRWKSPIALTPELLRSGLDYIRAHREVNDVLLSGGDPLLLSLERLEEILTSLRSIPHVEIIRIGTRAPAFLPQAVSADLAALLARHHPLFVNVHFNHPLEITPESASACTLLANAGIPLGSQTVLLKGINDRIDILTQLFQKLLRLRVRPYYLMQMDLTRGASHFRTPIHQGLEILHGLRNRISGLAVPQYVVDLPGGQGKVPLVPAHIEEVHSDRMLVRDWLGRPCSYPLLAGEGARLLPWLGRGVSAAASKGP